MKSLFDENECYTNEANDLDKKVGNFIRPIVKRMVEMGYSTREAESVILCAVNMTCFEERLGKQIKQSREKRNFEKNDI